MIAEQGEAAFYKGDIAKAILKTSSELGGTMTADDLSRIFRGVGRTHLHQIPRLDGV